MFLKSINCLHLLIEQTPLYQSKIKQSDREILIDKSNFIIDTIISGNRHVYNVAEYEAISLNNEILRTQLGTHYKAILSMLKNLDIIQTNDSYITTGIAKKLTNSTNKTYFAKSKSYELTTSAKAMEIVKVGVLNKRTIARINKHRTDLLKTYLKDKEIHSKIIYNTTNLHFTLTDEAETLKKLDFNNSDEKNHAKQCFQDLLQINQLKTTDDLKRSNNYFYNAHNKVGRVYHYYTTIPRYFRKHLKHTDGKQLAEIDLKNSQPLILGLLFRQAILNEPSPALSVSNKYINSSVLKWFDTNKTSLVTNTPPVLKEMQMLLNDLFAGTFYDTIKNKAEELNQSIGNNRDALKMLVLKTLYKPNKSVMSKNEMLVYSLYPNFIDFIRKIKAIRDYKEISHLAQIYESTIFISNIFPKLDNTSQINSFAIPVHDSLIIKSTEIDYFKGLLVNSMTSIFNIEHKTANKLFKIEHYA